MLDVAFTQIYEEEKINSKSISSLEEGRLAIKFLKNSDKPLENKFYLQNIINKYDHSTDSLSHSPFKIKRGYATSKYNGTNFMNIQTPKRVRKLLNNREEQEYDKS